MTLPADVLPARERLRMLELVVEHTSSMVVVTDAERRVRWVNPAYTVITGWTLDEVRGRHPRSFLQGPQTSLRAVSRLSGLLRRGEPVRQFELVNYKKSGQAFWTSLSIETIRDASGRVTDYVAIQEDITERKQRELESAQMLRRLARVQRLAKLGNMEHQLKSGCVYCSAEIFRILEAAEGEVDTAYDKLMERTHPEDRAAVRASYEAAIAARSPYESEHRVITFKGRVKWVHITGTLEAWHDGSPTICRLVVQDVTERKQAETLARDKAMLEQVARTQLEVLTRVSHELRTPLHAVLGFADIVERLEASRMSARSRGHMVQIRRAARHLLAMVNDILDMARLGDGRLPFDLQPVAMAPLAHEVVQMLEPMAAQRQVALEVVDASAAASVVRADRQRLMQVLINLAGNAIKYSHAGGRVRLRLAAAVGQRLVLQVEDDGPGIAARHLRRLFEPFYRVADQPAEATAAEGSGLGLAIAKSLVDGMGGAMEVHSRPGQGSTFSVQLPLAPEAPSAALPPPRPTHALRRPQPTMAACCTSRTVQSTAPSSKPIFRPGPD